MDKALTFSINTVPLFCTYWVIVHMVLTVNYEGSLVLQLWDLTGPITIYPVSITYQLSIIYQNCWCAVSPLRVSLSVAIHLLNQSLQR